MSWKDLLQKPNEEVTLPWIGGRSLCLQERSWKISGKLPEEYGWFVFQLQGQQAFILNPTDPLPEKLLSLTNGYLVGNRFVRDDVQVYLNPKTIAAHTEDVYLIEPGLDRFARIKAGRLFENGPLIYSGIEMSIGPEQDVLTAFLEEQPSVGHISGVSPALDASFRMETFQREEAKKRREELERLRREEEAKLAAEERRKEMEKQIGTALGRRAMAVVDFGEAARNALKVSGATYLDHRAGARKNEMAVRFRHENRRFECICDKLTLRIIDAGICLQAHNDDDDDFEYGTKGDTWLTLESLPPVISEAIREDKLVVFRHV